jgi:GTP-binding protein HflX
MAEAELLIDTYGGIVVEKSIQHRMHPHPNTYIGSGKLEWLQSVVQEKKIEVVVINAIVNSGQLFRMERALWAVNTRIAVWDRVDLILNIFEQHASSVEAKLQIQLARVKHTGPRIYGLGKTALSRQGGGIGTRGLGETNIEIERRNIKKIQQRIEKQIKERADEQRKRIYERQKRGVKTVALVGYTSAGKTTLFNILTGKQKKSHQSLFTTLDTVVGKIKLQHYIPAVLISDTIGFIDDLPPILIEAFRSTLLESMEAQLVLHVIDVSDPKMFEKITVVEDILQELHASQTRLYVFNKIDLLSPSQQAQLAAKYRGKSVVFVSAKSGEGSIELKQRTEEFLGRNF